MSTIEPNTTIWYLVNHVVLPPKLPSVDDTTAAHEKALLETVLQALKEIQSTLSTTEPVIAQKFDVAIQAIENLSHIRNDQSMVDEDKLAKLLHALATDGSTAVVPVEVTAQNAAVLVTRQDSDVVLEFFELLPQDELVMSTKGRLVRTFPTQAYQLPARALVQDGLIASLAQIISSISQQDIPEFRLRSGEHHAAPYDTTNPVMVSEYLASIFAALGELKAIDVISKNTRHETLTSSNVLPPWRRSSLWLLIRVVLQLVFSRFANQKEVGSWLYKASITQVVAEILRQASLAELDTEILRIISTRLSRRRRKLELSRSELHDLCLNPIGSLLVETHQAIHAIWETIMESTESDIDMRVLSNLRPFHDVHFNIPQLERWLERMTSRSVPRSSSGFNPTSELPSFDDVGLIFDYQPQGEFEYFYLLIVEDWVERELSDWLESEIDQKKTCQRLAGLIRAYYSNARQLYSDSDTPASASIMYLTVAELWVALDRCACHTHSLLKKYNPEIDSSPLRDLSLPLKSQMERLSKVETYLKSRKNRATQYLPSLFHNFGHSSSFAVKFFDQSPSHKKLHSQIVEEAAIDRQNKYEEYDELVEKYKSLMAQSNALECDEHETVYVGRKKRKAVLDTSNCEKCNIRQEAERMTIAVHEWPLSDVDAEAKAVVFELRIPEGYSHWRDATLFVMMTVLGFERRGDIQKPAAYTLYKYAGLARYQKAISNQEVGVFSSTKPLFGVLKKIKHHFSVVGKHDIVVGNQLKYKLFELNKKTDTKLPLEELAPTPKVRKDCMYRLPERSRHLERYLAPSLSTQDATPNSVVASLSQCPETFSMDEYKAFSALAMGYNIQYLNILAQLASPIIDFSKPETQTMIQQVVHRVGIETDENTSERAAHKILTDTRFCRVMLLQIEKTLPRYQSNWETWRALATCIILVVRILEVNDNQDIYERCIGLLSTARKISSGWVQILEQRLHDARDNHAEIAYRRTEIALVCISTFDINENYFVDILDSSAVSILIRMSILIQETKDTVNSEHRFLYRASIQSWRCLLFRILPTIREGIVSGDFQKSMNKALLASCPGLRTPTDWVITDDINELWARVTCDTRSVHLNLLTAELLVEGEALTRLPTKYVEHEAYERLFDNFAMEATSTDEPGMSFSAKNPCSEHLVQLGWDRGDLLVVATKDGHKFELIPSRFFKGILPTHFELDFVHWYSHDQKTIEFRPIRTPWKSETGNWVLRKSGPQWMFECSRYELINPMSNTGKVLLKTMSPLENQQHIHVMLDKATSTTTIRFHRLHVEFDMLHTREHIESRQYPGMIVDSNQCIGTLVGLTSKLVLREKHEADNRLVLVPEGSFKYSKTKNHVTVQVEQDTITKLHPYQIDKVLLRVLDNNSLRSKLLLALLHGLTSHCLPDKATGHTGTESALSILRSAAILSFDKLAAEDMDILEAIAKLTPVRAFVPSCVTAMEKVQWDLELPIMSQHPSYFLVANRIFEEHKKRSIFHGRKIPGTMIKSESWNLTLLDRNRIRSSIFRVDGFGAECYTRAFDTIYLGRDKTLGSERSVRSLTAAKTILRDEPALHSAFQAEDFRSFMLDRYFDKKIVGGTDQTVEVASLVFQPSCLQEPSVFLAKYWCILHTSLSGSPELFDKFSMAAWLSALAFAKDANMDVIQALIAFYKIPVLASINVPACKNYNLSETWVPSESRIRNIVEGRLRHFEDSPDYKSRRQGDETEMQYYTRRQTTWINNRKIHVDTFVHDIHEQWPSAALSEPNIQHAHHYIHVGLAMAQLKSLFRTWFNNYRFFGYLGRVSDALKNIQVTPVPDLQVRPTPPPKNKVYGNDGYLFTKDVLFGIKAPLSTKISRHQGDLTWPVEPEIDFSWTVTSTFDRRTGANDDLSTLCDRLELIASSQSEEKYVSDLRDSRRSLKSTREELHILAEGELEELLQKYFTQCQEYLMEVHTVLKQAIGSREDIEVLIDHCPRLCPTFLLSQLHKDQFGTLPEGWKKVVINYGLAIVKLQRAKRLLSLSKRPADLAQELRNIGHENWDPNEFPETLLFEAENSLLVRQVQEEIAQQMRNPPADQNSVMVLNMGEGKSSVIVPIVAAALTDRHSLVRVIVAKPQKKQMYQTLIERLGGLLNRRIYHMPFERRQKLTANEARIIGDICKECIRNRGILLLQPEHILSFQNMGIEALLAEKPDVSRQLLQTQELFDQKSRDIVDESDENFSIKFELVYTVGCQAAIEMCPQRWQIAHAILDLVAHYAPQVKVEYPGSIEVTYQEDNVFPRIRLLKDDSTEKLLDLIAEHICRVNFPFLAIYRQPPEVQQAALLFIRNSELTSEQICHVEESVLWNESIRGTLLLIRGLIASGILRFALKNKRYRVNYGLDLVRMPKTNLAVPYRSKDCPTFGSEFSHPEVVIVLTSLTYYYGGLSDDALFNAFAYLFRTDQANMEYENWIRSATKPLSGLFQNLSGVNLEDRFQCIQHVFPSLRYSKAAIDFYLSYVVFPKSMKEFSHKLSASGWDIGKVKSNPTTGFSGTSDARHTLPLSVHHLDLPMQKPTNALVLKHLMKSENSIVLLPQRDGANDRMSNAEYLLDTLNSMNPEIRVILDVGAQILELNNLQVAEKWLQISSEDVEAVVFFSDEEELSILDRDGRVEPLQTSPFTKKLDVCLVYLDEAHTRGTDLRLPAKYRAAVTLGANLTKDRLVQACMRLRNLSKEQSVVFCISEEIASKIREVASKEAIDDIEVQDVLVWAITETWQELKRIIPLWATQGQRFEKSKYFQNGTRTTKQQAESLLEADGQTLLRRYQPRNRQANTNGPLFDMSNENIIRILRRCQDFGALNFDSTTLSEEQERELATEIEEELRVQKPPPMTPEVHELHADVQQLVTTGKVKKNSKAFKPAFEALSSISAAANFSVASFPKDLMVTTDYIRTVKPPAGLSEKPFNSDSYHRPVQWVLAVYKSQKDHAIKHLVILSPFEAQHLFQKIERTKAVSLHIYAPRMSLVHEPMDTLDLFAIGHPFDSSLLPRSLVVELNLFSGQLYMNSYEEYAELCGFIGVSHLPSWEGHTVQADDGFVVPPIGKWGFEKSPVRFLRDFVSQIRREGSGMDKTHLGKMLEGKMLTEGEFGESLFVGDDE